jgi:hypothetical protein
MVKTRGSTAEKKENSISIKAIKKLKNNFVQKTAKKTTPIKAVKSSLIFALSTGSKKYPTGLERILQE